MFNYLLNLLSQTTNLYKKYIMSENIDDMPLFLRRDPLGAARKVVHDNIENSSTHTPPNDKPAVYAPGELTTESLGRDLGSLIPGSDNEVAIGISEFSKAGKRRRTITFKTWDKDLNAFVEFERTFEDINDPDDKGILKRRKDSFTEGWVFFDEKDLLNLNGETLLKLCPYKTPSYEATEWWRGWYSGAKWYWHPHDQVVGE